MDRDLEDQRGQESPMYLARLMSQQPPEVERFYNQVCPIWGKLVPIISEEDFSDIDRPPASVNIKKY